MIIDLFPSKTFPFPIKKSKFLKKPIIYYK